MSQADQYKLPFIRALSQYGYAEGPLTHPTTSPVALARRQGISEAHISGAFHLLKFPIAHDCTKEDDVPNLYIGVYEHQNVFAADDPFDDETEQHAGGFLAFRASVPPQAPPQTVNATPTELSRHRPVQTIMDALHLLGYGNIQPQELTQASYHETLLQTGRITDEQLAMAYAKIANVPYIDPRRDPPQPDVRNVISVAKILEQRIIPHSWHDDELVVLTADPTDSFAMTVVEDELQDVKLRTATASRSAIEQLILTYYTRVEHEAALAQAAQQRRAEYDETADTDVLEADSPVAKRIVLAIQEASANDASDIHFQPERGGLYVRERLHGNLIDRSIIPEELARQTINRLKILCRMSLEDPEPQDARITFPLTINGREQLLRMRVNTLSSVHGDSIVMRLLKDVSTLPSLDDTDYTPKNRELLQQALEASNGIILVTGPTGSGKTTAMHTILSSLNHPDVKIMTSENPVEYEQPRMVQTEVRGNLTFASILRAQLRQDPDILFVGEIRDEETARISVQAATTGHLVLSTVHTNDAVSTVTRLRDFEVPPYMISDTVRLIVSQRLVGRPCPECSIEEPIPAEYQLPGYPTTMLSGTGEKNGQVCPLCSGTGDYKRIAIHEVLPMTPAVREAIRLGDVPSLQLAAQTSGMTTIREDGLIKVAQQQANLKRVLAETN